MDGVLIWTTAASGQPASDGAAMTFLQRDRESSPLNAERFSKSNLLPNYDQLWATTGATSAATWSPPSLQLSHWSLSSERVWQRKKSPDTQRSMMLPGAPHVTCTKATAATGGVRDQPLWTWPSSRGWSLSYRAPKYAEHPLWVCFRLVGTQRHSNCSV